MDSWQRVFPVGVLGREPGAAEGTLRPMMGRYEVLENQLRFIPRYPWKSGVEYRAEFRPQGQVVASSGFRAREVSREATIVRTIHPESEVVPENLLKFYVEFSGPMSRGDSYAHLRLVNDRGHEVDLPFLELAEELWNAEMTRLTVLIDPGRIKRGVRPLEEVGPVLEAGREYVLSVDSQWLDAFGKPLARSHEKRFRVVPADREFDSPSRWEITPPRAGSQGELKVCFSEVLDHALALRLLGVADERGQAVEGTIRLGRADREWILSPRESWKPGAYRLIIPALLEDLAGNNPGKPFDEDPGLAATRAAAGESLAFFIHPP